LAALLAAAAALALLGLGFYIYAGWYGFNVILRRGGSIWITVDPGDPRISKSMQLALRVPPPPAQAGALNWVARRDGFETAEMPVLVAGGEADRLLLARIEPTKFRFEVHIKPAGNYDLGDWMQELHASLVMNGSYFGRDGHPDTPVLSNGRHWGPTSYRAIHGAFVASDSSSGIRDLQREDWRDLFKRFRQGMVSYPLLVGAAPTRVAGDPRWLANRTFVGEDSQGRILVGTTKDAFFSLKRFALFLRQAPLDLTRALNLDGGPVACQGISVPGYRREFCGKWETRVEGGRLQLLRPLLGSRRWALPIVLAAAPK
jgi:hypothetical protein